MLNKILKNQLNFIIFSYFLFSLLVLSFFNLNISPDGRYYLECAENLFQQTSVGSKICNKQYYASFLIFKLLNVVDLTISFQIFNLVVFFFIFLNCIKIMKNFDVEIDSIIKMFYFLGLFIFNYDFSQWINYALTDLILILNILISINLFIKSKYKLLIIMILLSLLIKRQSILLLLILAFMYFELKNYENHFLKSLLNILKVYSPILLILFLFIITEKFSLINLDIPGITGIIKFVFFKTVEEGIIVMNRVYLHIDTTNFLSVLQIYIARFGYSLSFYFNDYSFKHKIYNIIYFTILIWPMILLFKIKEFSILNKKLLNFNFSIVVLILIFIIMTFLDYDMRYRIYIFPFLIMNNYILIDKIFKKI